MQQQKITQQFFPTPQGGLRNRAAPGVGEEVGVRGSVGAAGRDEKKS